MVSLNFTVEKRYTCVHATCLARRDASPTYFSTWTALQHHIRTVHPPICSHPACNGKSFKSQKGLRAHLKLHDQSEAETTLRVDFDTDSEQSDPPRKMRRGGEVGRDWVCDVNGCGKDFKSVRQFFVYFVPIGADCTFKEKSVHHAQQGNPSW